MCFKRAFWLKTATRKGDYPNVSPLKTAPHTCIHKIIDNVPLLKACPGATLIAHSPRSKK